MYETAQSVENENRGKSGNSVENGKNIKKNKNQKRKSTKNEKKFQKRNKSTKSGGENGVKKNNTEIEKKKTDPENKQVSSNPYARIKGALLDLPETRRRSAARPRSPAHSPPRKDDCQGGE